MGVEQKRRRCRLLHTYTLKNFTMHTQASMNIQCVRRDDTV